MSHLKNTVKSVVGILFLHLFFSSPSSAETIKARIGGGLYQGPRAFVVVDIDGQEVKARYTENVTTWCPPSCPWYDHFAIAYKACPLRKPGDFSAQDDAQCITSAGESIVFPEGVRPEDYSILFQYKKGGIVEMKEFSIEELRKTHGKKPRKSREMDRS